MPKKKKKITDLRYVFILLTKRTRFQCSDDFKEVQIENMKNLCINILCFQLRLNSQQILRTFYTGRTKEKCINNKNIKGHFVVLVLCFVLLHKYCYSTAHIQGPENRCVHVSPFGWTTGRRVNVSNKCLIIDASLCLCCVTDATSC